ncbi:MAG: hypothetical protein RL264_1477 [Bacteroidota bacterium]|jgi:hypothetical protein
MFSKSLCIFLLFLSFTTYAQQANPALFKSYSKKEIKEISANNPEDIAVLNYALEHAVSYIEVPNGKDFPSKQLKSLKNTTRFTDYGIQIKEQTQYFTFPNTNKIMAVKSMYHLRLEMKNSK